MREIGEEQSNGERGGDLEMVDGEGGEERD